MRIKVRYLVEKPGAAGKPSRWFWQPSADLRAFGWRPQRLKHRDGRPAQTLDEAVALAQALNQELDNWRSGGGLQSATTPPPVPPLQTVQENTVAHVIRLYKSHRRFAELAPKTRLEYGRCLEHIERWAGDAPITAITRQTVQDYYEAQMDTGKLATANARLRVLRILLQYACDKDMIVGGNPAEKPGMVGTAPRLRVWSDDELAAFVGAADAMGYPGMADAVVLAIATGQRQGDLLKLPLLAVRPNHDGGYTLHVQQAKRGARVAVPLLPSAAARLAGADARRASLNAARADKGLRPVSTVLWNDSTGEAWNADTFRHIFSDVRSESTKVCPSIADVTYQDCRDTAVTAYATAGCTIPELCAITGHQEASATQVLKHYLALNGEMASSAVAKLLAFQERKLKAGRDG
jgi:integrase